MRNELREIKIRIDETKETVQKESAEIRKGLEEIKEGTLNEILEGLRTQLDLLKERLPNSDWKRIKGAWDDYKNGKIDKKTLVLKGGVGLLKKVASIFNIPIE